MTATSSFGNAADLTGFICFLIGTAAGAHESIMTHSGSISLKVNNGQKLMKPSSDIQVASIFPESL